MCLITCVKFDNFINFGNSPRWVNCDKYCMAHGCATSKNSVHRREAVPKTQLDPTELVYLKTLFKKADTTADGKLAVNELTFAIQKTVAKHIQE